MAKMRDYGLKTVEEFLNHWMMHTGLFVIMSESYYDEIDDAIGQQNLRDFLEHHECIIALDSALNAYVLGAILKENIAQAEVMHFGISFEEKIVVITIDDNFLYKPTKS